MRWPLVLLVAACGDNANAIKDAPAPADTPPDVAVVPMCVGPIAGTQISMRQIVNIGDAAMLVTAPVGDPRLFVVGQSGSIRIVRDGVLVESPFLDIGDQIAAGGERGLLGLAFHPQYATNRQFFIYYTRGQSGDTTYPLRDVVARCEASASDPDRAEAPSCVEILAIKDRFGNHNGGMVEFGPDGFLYIGTGDGGSANDPDGNGQTVFDGVPAETSVALLAKLLRIDVDHPASGLDYGIPADNPFALTGGAPEIFALGLRNPWRFTFDSQTGDLWIGDVGQGAIEEIQFVKAGEIAGKNFGWSMYEGSNCFKPPCDPAGKTFPQDERTHDADAYTAIIGGQVYRGSCYPDLVGTYFYGDNTGRQYATATEADGALTIADLVPRTGEMFPDGLSSIHADSRGELYVTTTGGGVFHIEAGL